MSTPGSGLFEEGEPEKRKKRAKRRSAQVFIEYDQEQMQLLPPSLQELIPERHVVRVVSRVIDGLDLGELVRSYKGSGRSAYDPRMLLKVLLYGYVMRVYQGRMLARAVRQDIHFMWLAGMQTPDHRTINGFRSGRLRGEIERVFVSLVEFLHRHKYISLEQYFVDGTKIQANANRHKAVWRKRTKRLQDVIREKVREQFLEIDRLQEEEDRRYGDRDLEELGNESDLTSESLREEVQRLNEILQKKPSGENSRRLARAVRHLERVELPKLEKYEEQERILAGRSSYSRTDPSATFMRMKDGQTLPAYNVLAGVENQFVVGYTLHNRATEPDCLPAHLAWFRRQYGRDPRAMIADRAFGSEENYEILEAQKTLAYIPPPDPRRKGMFGKNDFSYDPESDVFTCPADRPLPLRGDGVRSSRTGHHTYVRHYQCEDCSDCPFTVNCRTGTGPRSLYVSPRTEYHAEKARERLKTDEGQALYKRRPVECESVFGDVKWNQGHRRYGLRGEEKVTVETGLLFLAHNLKILGMKIN